MNKQIIAIIAIIVLSLVVSKKKEDCNVLTCSTTDVSTDLGQCASASKNTNGTGFTVSLQTCKSGYYCPSAVGILTSAMTSTSSSATANCVKDPNSSFWGDLADTVGDLFDTDYCTGQAPGESCSNDTHCASLKCENKECVGTAVDGSCTSDINCNAGLYCNVNKCANQKAENATCTRDNECVNSHACSNGKCIKYYTLAAGAESTNAYACTTALIKVGATKSICDTMTLTTNKCPDTDAADSCVYTYASDSSKVQMDCQCDKTGKTLSVSCPAVENTKMTIYENIHTTLRYSGSCKSNYSGLDSCVAETYYGGLYTNNSTIFKVGFVLLAALMMLF